MSNIEVKLNPDVVPSGSDLAVVNAARRSFNSRSTWEVVEIYDSTAGSSGLGGITFKQKLRESDKRLIHFLARGMTADDFEGFVNSNSIIESPYGDFINKEELVKKLWKWRNTPTHDTPINHCFISFEVKAPIFVSRQLVKHEYLIMSEFSRRYITDEVEFYEPDYWRKAAENKKQGSLEEPVELPESHPWYGSYQVEIQESIKYYEHLIHQGVAPEQARMVLPQSTMTEWTWSGTLGAFCKMCQLRLHPEAQYEARLVAQKVYDYLLEYYPVTAKAFVEGVN